MLHSQLLRELLADPAQALPVANLWIAVPEAVRLIRSLGLWDTGAALACGALGAVKIVTPDVTLWSGTTDPGCL